MKLRKLEPTPEDFKELLVALGGGPGRRAKLARELSRSYWEVARWFRTNYVPEWAWSDLMRLASKQGVSGINSEYLHELSAKGNVFMQRGKYPRPPKDESIAKPRKTRK